MTAQILPMLRSGGKPDITETGLRGFLKWLQREQPHVYRKAAPIITRAAPGGFSDYHSSCVTQMRRAAGMRAQQRTGHFLTEHAMQMGDVGTNIALDDSMLQSVPVADPSIPSINFPPDTADAANTGTTSTSVSDTISNILTGIMQVGLAKNQLDTAKQVTQIQLQRAQAGLPPLNIDMSKMGVPQVAVGIAPGTQSLVLWVGGGLALALLLGLIGHGRGKRA